MTYQLATLLNWVEKVTTMDAIVDGESMEYKLKVEKMLNNLNKKHSKVLSSKRPWDREV